MSELESAGIHPDRIISVWLSSVLIKSHMHQLFAGMMILILMHLYPQEKVYAGCR